MKNTALNNNGNNDVSHKLLESVAEFENSALELFVAGDSEQWINSVRSKSTNLLVSMSMFHEIEIPNRLGEIMNEAPRIKPSIEGLANTTTFLVGEIESILRHLNSMRKEVKNKGSQSPDHKKQVELLKEDSALVIFKIREVDCALRRWRQESLMRDVGGEG